MYGNISDEHKFGNASVYYNGAEYRYTNVGGDPERTLVSNSPRHVDAIIKENERYKLRLSTIEKRKIEAASKFFNGTTGEICLGLCTHSRLHVKDVRFALGQINRLVSLFTHVQFHVTTDRHIQDTQETLKIIRDELIELSKKEVLIRDFECVELQTTYERRGKRGPLNECRDQSIKIHLPSWVRDQAKDRINAINSGEEKTSLNKELLRLILSRKFPVRINPSFIADMNEAGSNFKFMLLDNLERFSNKNISDFDLINTLKSIEQNACEVIREQPTMICVNDLVDLRDIPSDYHDITNPDPIATLNPVPSHLATGVIDRL